MKDNKYIIPSLIAVAIIMIVIGSTFAYWNWQSTNAQKTNVTFTVGANFSCSADGGGTITNTAYFVPTDCTNTTYAIQRTIITSITNTGSNPIYLDMWLNINSIGSGLSGSENFKYALTTNSSSCSTDVVAQGNFYGKQADDKIELLSDISTAGTYYLYVWLDSAETSQSTMNQSVSLSIGGECTDQEPATLINKIAKNAVMDNISSTYVSNVNGIQFNSSVNGNNGKGVYIRNGTQNTAHPIYYYRGAVTDNNVLFAGFCWKIVRTTDTGGIKLVYNGLPSGTNNGECTNTTGSATQLTTTSLFNTNYTSLAEVGYMYGTKYVSSTRSSGNLATSYKYGNSVTYSGGTYTLVNTINSTGTWATDYNTLNNNHYTCFNTTGTCSSVYYIHYTEAGFAYYITLTNGKLIGDALSEMLTNSSNTTSSTIKTAIDTWYSTNMTSYTSYLEDTIWCNDRSISNLGGWSPNGGDTTQPMYFNPYTRANVTHTPSFTCAKNDAFTVNETSVGNGDLTYPVGLLTVDEMKLAGALWDLSYTTYYLYTDSNYWLGSPYYFNMDNAVVFKLNASGNLGASFVSDYYGVRPSVSLKSDTLISGGSGTSTDPYTVSYS